MSKLKETILYILNKRGPMSAEKLEGLLYFLDFDNYELHEKPFFKDVKWKKGKERPELTINRPFQPQILKHGKKK